MKNILVTGGAGFIGSHTVVELVEAGYSPIIIDNFSNSNVDALNGIEQIVKRKIPCFNQDYQDKRKLSELFQKHSIGGVIHFAAYKAVGESVEQPLKYYSNNVAGLVTLLEVMHENNTQNLVFSSSCTVYGEPDVLPIKENAPVKPAESPYGATKQMCETIIKDTSRVGGGPRSLALRYFNPIGAHPSAKIGELPTGVPANLVPFVTQTAAGLRDSLTIHGNDYPTSDGTCIRDYIHVVDLARAHVSALRKLEKETDNYFDVCNIGTGKGSSVLDVITTFERVTRKKLPYTFGPRRDGDIVSTYADADKARKILGWQSEKTLEVALIDAWNWQKSLTSRD